MHACTSSTYIAKEEQEVQGQLGYMKLCLKKANQIKIICSKFKSELLVLMYKYIHTYFLLLLFVFEDRVSLWRVDILKTTVIKIYFLNPEVGLGWVGRTST